MEWGQTTSSALAGIGHSQIQSSRARCASWASVQIAKGPSSKLQFWLDGSDDTLGYSILKFEDVTNS